MPASIPLPPQCSVGISWDNAAQRPVDLDLAALVIDGTGLIIDACFFNKPTALEGGLVHSGDATDGATFGVDESIAVSLASIPPFACAIVFVAMCANAGDFGPCETAQLHCFVSGSSTGLMPPVSLGMASAAKSTVVVLGIARRGADKTTFQFEAAVSGFPAPARTFLDVYDKILAMVNIDPVMAVELEGRQPTFNLVKGQSVTLPVGMKEVMFGLGWDSRCDVDAGCVGLRLDGSTEFTVYFGNKKFEDIVVHSGDNMTGAGSGDDEQIRVLIDRLPPSVTAIFFTVNVYSSGRSFNDVDGEYCRLVDLSPGPNHGREMVKFRSLDSGKYNGIVIVALYRNLSFPQQWEFSAESLPAQGNTVNSLVDECQALQRSKRSGEPLEAEYSAVASFQRDLPAPAPAPAPFPAEERSLPPPPSGERQAKSDDGCCTVQ